MRNLDAANRQVLNSMQALANAQANIAKVEKQNADSIASAQRGLISAQQGLVSAQRALAQAHQQVAIFAGQASSANSALARAMAELSPAPLVLMGHWKAFSTAFTDWAKTMEPTV